ncbi:TetR/AcrR family transcriptional regulator [uncultured Jatrophihabitans sp.]|uniref:TetR/AcrR family transcriptional regulator n=1 Tax=uncultured Jatrophihabitans sp. TaxID=1610747 RepID=UPI0035CBACB1
MRTETARVGRPRSEQARSAVLHAVDDLLVEVGYAAMTMKGIAERAGVGRQTVYRWWSTKAEILFEASVIDARQELAVPVTGDALHDTTAYVDALIAFLSRSDAGAAYRALLGEAQHDRAVAELLAGTDVLGDSARAVLAAGRGDEGPSADVLDRATAALVGPVLYWVLSGRDANRLDARRIAGASLRELD